MKLAQVILLSTLLPIGASASQEVACFYDGETTSGSFLLHPGKVQAHIEVEQIADGVDEEMLDGVGVEQDFGFDVNAWINSFLNQGQVTKGYIAIAKRTGVSTEISMSVAEIVDGKVANVRSVEGNLVIPQDSQILGRLACRLRKNTTL